MSQQPTSVVPAANGVRSVPCAPPTSSKHTPDDYQVGGVHYKNMSVQPWAVVDSWPIEQRIGFYRGNALKYLMRMGAKDNAVEDIRKAIHYLEKLLTIWGAGA